MRPCLPWRLIIRGSLSAINEPARWISCRLRHCAWRLVLGGIPVWGYRSFTRRGRMRRDSMLHPEMFFVEVRIDYRVAFTTEPSSMGVPELAVRFSQVAGVAAWLDHRFAEFTSNQNWFVRIPADGR